MTATGYKVLGWVVWKGATWFVRRRYGRYARPAAAAVVIAAVGAVALGVARNDDGLG